MRHMLQKKAYSIRIYPTRTQKELIRKTIDASRFVYNYSLASQNKKNELWFIVEEMVQQGYFEKNNYQSGFFNKFQAIKDVAELKKNHTWLKEVDSIALQSSVEDLAVGFQKHYKKAAGKPRFKSKKNPSRSYTTKSVSSNISVFDNAVKLPKLGLVKAKNTQIVKGTIKRATVSMRASGKYYVSILCEVDIETLPVVQQHVGVDVGLKTFAVCSDGREFAKPKSLKQKEERLAFLQRSLSRKQYNSMNYKKTKQLIARLHESIVNQRTDFLHKVSTTLIRENQSIAIENLKVKDMLKNKDLSKSISEASWYEFRRMLEYKAAWYGRNIIVAPTHFASSQLCSCCGFKHTAVKSLNQIGRAHV